MAGLEAAIHVFLHSQTWMPGTGPGMTRVWIEDRGAEGLTGHPPPPEGKVRVRGLHRPHFDDVGHEMAQQILDAML